jgi:hypothetical protein
VHPLINGKNPAPEGSTYSFAMLENDVVLQQMRGTTKRSEVWQAKGGAADTQPLLSEPKEYKLKVGPQTSRFAFQIAENPEGMAIRYEFAPAAAQLSSMMVALDDDEVGGGAPPVQPTMVMEVDLGERIVIERHEGFLSVMAQGGGFLPSAGGDPGLVAGVQVSATLPWINRMFLVSAQGLVLWHTLGANIGDVYGGAINAKSTVYAVPILAKATARYPFGASRFAAFAHAGAGLCYISASRTALNASETASHWGWAARGGGGLELDIGAGGVGLEAAYLLAPKTTLGKVLDGYSPTGPTLALQYRLGI